MPSNAPKPKSDIRIITDRFCALYLERYGIKYSFSGAKDGGLVSKLVKDFGVEATGQLVEAFFASTDPFIQRAGHTIGVMWGCRNKLMQTMTKQDKYGQAGIRNI